MPKMIPSVAMHCTSTMSSPHIYIMGALPRKVSSCSALLVRKNTVACAPRGTTRHTSGDKACSRNRGGDLGTPAVGGLLACSASLGAAAAATAGQRGAWEGEEGQRADLVPVGGRGADARQNRADIRLSAAAGRGLESSQPLLDRDVSHGFGAASSAGWQGGGLRGPMGLF
eukprot:SAG22_NODE_693_length_7872_cov_13.111797_10_plen_171_part_00